MIQEISRQDIQKALQEGNVTLIEALPEKYYNDGHLPGALQMNYTEVEEKAADLLPNKDAPIVTYCANEECKNSAYAAEQLTAMGYTNVKKYVGGKKDWVENGGNVEK